jgi:hypothetical protein
MSKVKLLNLLVVLALLLSYPLSSGITTAQARPASSEIISEFDSPEQPSQALALPIIADFEGGIPAGFVGFADSWDGSGSTTTLQMVTATMPLPVMPAATSNTVVSSSIARLIDRLMDTKVLPSPGIELVIMMRFARSMGEADFP